MLKETSARQSFFSELAKPDSADHSEVSKVKSRINKLIEQEIALAGFKD